MRVSHVFATVVLTNLVAYSSCTVLAATGYVFSYPSVRNFLVKSGLGDLMSRKSASLYDASNFRYTSDRGTDIKTAQMGNYEIVEVEPSATEKLRRIGLHVHEQNNSIAEERLYSEKLFGVLKEMDRNSCISRLLCEIGADPKSFGIIGFKINHYLKSVPPVTWNSATHPYLEAFQGGLHKTACDQYYGTCTYDLRRVTKALWPFVKPINVKLSYGL